MYCYVVGFGTLKQQEAISINQSDNERLRYDDRGDGEGDGVEHDGICAGYGEGAVGEVRV